MKKNKQSGDTSILFVDASREFVKVTNNNRLSKENRDKIVNAVEKRENVPYFATLASLDDIKKEDYNLSVNMYVEQEDTSEKVDIVELNKRIDTIVHHEEELRREIDKIVAELTPLLVAEEEGGEEGEGGKKGVESGSSSDDDSGMASGLIAGTGAGASMNSDPAHGGASAAKKEAA